MTKASGTLTRDALDVANWFIDTSGYTKTNLQVQKMTYIAHGYMLAIHDVPLIRDRVEAWQHGPVIPKIYHEYKRWRSGVIGRIRYKPDPFTDIESELLMAVFTNYGKYCGYYLSQITHRDGDVSTPWAQCYVASTNMPIPNSITQAYYKARIEKV